MKMPNRDLLVLVKDNHLSEKAMENELEQLNQLLLHFETFENFCIAHEVFDMNKFKRLRDAKLMRKLVNQKEIEPFVFICNMN